MPARNVFNEVCVKISLYTEKIMTVCNAVYAGRKKIITVRNAIYFRLCIDLMHILPQVTAEGFDGSHHPRFAEWTEIFTHDQIQNAAFMAFEYFNQVSR